MRIITEISDYVGLGVTNPMHASIDGERVIIKSIENDETHVALFNESLGYEMAKCIGLRHPEFGVAFYRESITKVNRNNITVDSFADNHLFTYTLYSNKITPIVSPRMTDGISDEEILKLIIFDIFMSNTDRNKGNLLIKMPKKNNSGSVLFPIDYTHILPGRCLWQDILRQNNYNISSIISEVFESNFYQYLIEERKFDVSKIDTIGDGIYEKIEDIDFAEKIKCVHDDIRSRIDEPDLALVISYLEYMRNHFKVLVDEVKIRIGRGE